MRYIHPSARWSAVRRRTTRRMAARCAPHASALALTLALILGCAGERDAAPPLPPLPNPQLLGAFRAATEAGYDALAADSLEAALTHFAQLRHLAPASPRADYHSACAYSRSGDTTAAVAALERAIEAGFSDPVEVATDPDLAAVRAHAAWPRLETRMNAQRAAEEQALRGLYQRRAPESEPRFATFAACQAHYDSLRRVARMAAWVYPELTSARLRAEIVNRRIAALRRFAQEHDDFGRYDLLVATLAAQSELPEIDRRPWQLGREAARYTADLILADYPDSSGAALAALWQVRADWYGSIDGPPSEAGSQALADVIADLRAVGDRYPGTPGGCEARIEAVVLAAEQSPDLAPLRPLLTELEADCGLDPRRLGSYGYRVIELALRAQGAPDFAVSDIDGRRWSLAALRGRHVLLDFWATWCGPCRAEIPRLVALAERYPPEELQILGISLDLSDRLSEEELREWTRTRGMTWPQIYDGQAWESTLAQLYHIPAIPFPVLIGPTGEVLAAGDGARGEALEQVLAAALGRQRASE